MAKDMPLVPEFWNDFGLCDCDRDILGNALKSNQHGKLFVSSRSSDKANIIFRWIGLQPCNLMVHSIVFGNGTMTINDSDLFKRGTNASSNTTEDEWHQFIDIVRAKWFELRPTTLANDGPVPLSPNKEEKAMKKEKKQKKVSKKVVISSSSETSDEGSLESSEEEEESFSQSSVHAKPKRASRNKKKSIEKEEEEMIDDAEYCDICHYPALVSIGDILLVCKTCDIRVHKDCYGFQGIKNSKNWYCDVCREVSKTNDLTKEYKCCMCDQSGGAMNKTNQGSWIHAECAFWTNCSIEKNRVREVESSLKARQVLTCKICKKQGGCIQCMSPDCHVSYHVPCAQKKDYALTVIDYAGQTFCKKHTPVENSAKGPVILVEKILSHRFNRELSMMEWEVKWSDGDGTWEPREHFFRDTIHGTGPVNAKWKKYEADRGIDVKKPKECIGDTSHKMPKSNKKNKNNNNNNNNNNVLKEKEVKNIKKASKKKELKVATPSKFNLRNNNNNNNANDNMLVMINTKIQPSNQNYNNNNNNNNDNLLDTSSTRSSSSKKKLSAADQFFKSSSGSAKKNFHVGVSALEGRKTRSKSLSLDEGNQNSSKTNNNNKIKKNSKRPRSESDNSQAPNKSNKRNNNNNNNTKQARPGTEENNDNDNNNNDNNNIQIKVAVDSPKNWSTEMLLDKFESLDQTLKFEENVKKSFHDQFIDGAAFLLMIREDFLALDSLPMGQRVKLLEIQSSLKEKHAI